MLRCRSVLACATFAFGSAFRAAEAPAATVPSPTRSSPPTKAAPEDPRHIAKVCFDEALELANRGAFADAAVKLRRAYAAVPDYAVLFNLAQVYVALGKPVESVATFERYIAEGGPRIAEPRRAAVAAQIEEQRGRTARLHVVTEPPGAAVFVDGRPVRASELTQGLPLNPGEHVVHSVLESFEPSIVQTDLLGGMESTVELRLVPARRPSVSPSEGRVLIRCSVPDVHVRVDGKLVDPLLSQGVLVLVPGAHRFTFERRGYEMQTTWVHMEANGATSVDCAMAPLRILGAHESGELRVVGAGGAKVLIDGVPMHRVLLPSGRHRVEILDGSSGAWSGVVSVRAGKLTTVQAPREPLGIAPVRPDSRVWPTPRTLLVGGVGVTLGAAALTAFLVSAHEFDRYERTGQDEKLAASVERWDAAAGILAGASGALIVGAFLMAWEESPSDEVATSRQPATGPTLSVSETRVSAGWRARW